MFAVLQITPPKKTNMMYPGFNDIVTSSGANNTYSSLPASYTSLPASYTSLPASYPSNTDYSTKPSSYDGRVLASPSLQSRPSYLSPAAGEIEYFIHYSAYIIMTYSLKFINLYNAQSYTVPAYE